MRLRLRIFVAVFAVVLSAGFSVQAAGLRILLTNDDGYAAPGLQAMRGALLAAGNDVTVVAPLGNQSGVGAGFNIDFGGMIGVVEQSPGVWSVDGKPADAVFIGLKSIMAANPPDLVVSGSNFGQNIGSIVVSSGTVGAAVIAIQNGVPAIAVSVGVNFDEQGATPIPFPSTFASFGPAGQYTAEVIEKLQATQFTGQALLPDHAALNINYPAIPGGSPLGVKFTKLSQDTQFLPAYMDIGVPGQLLIIPDITGAVGEEHSDLKAFQEGYISVSTLDGDWTANPLLGFFTALRLGIDH